VTGGAILVTGATGTGGRRVVEQLVAAGETVRAAVRDPRSALPAGQPVRFDFADPTSWSGALDGVDRLFLMRPPAISDVTTYLRPVINMAASRGVRHVVFLSLIGVNRVMPHWRVEQDIAAAGLAYTFLRPSFFAQNLLTAYRADIRDRDEIRLPAGRGRTAFVDTRDVAEVAARVLIRPADHVSCAYSLTGEPALGWDDVAVLLTRELQRPIRYASISFRRYRRELLAAGADPVYVRVQLGIHLVARLGLAGRITPTLRELLGRPPGTFAAFVGDYAAAWRLAETG
jgi:uncharacterized protein YbjT (DUF2867 family)